MGLYESKNKNYLIIDWKKNFLKPKNRSSIFTFVSVCLSIRSLQATMFDLETKFYDWGILRTWVKQVFFQFLKILSFTDFFYFWGFLKFQSFVIYEDISLKFGTLMYYNLIINNTRNDIFPKIDIFWFIDTLMKKNFRLSQKKYILLKC